MSRNYHDVWRGKKVLQHGSTNAIGPLSSNPRHPKKFKLAPMDKKTAPGDSPAWAAETVYQFPREAVWP